eukprot:6458909-Amphidinium_carterae.1
MEMLVVRSMCATSAAGTTHGSKSISTERKPLLSLLCVVTVVLLCVSSNVAHSWTQKWQTKAAIGVGMMRLGLLVWFVFWRFSREWAT